MRRTGQIASALAVAALATVGLAGGCGGPVSCTMGFDLANGSTGRACVTISPHNQYDALDIADVCARNEANVPNDAACPTEGRIGTCSDLSGETGPNGEVIAYNATFYGDAGATADDARAFCESFMGSFAAAN